MLYYVVDTETTGLKAGWHEVTEVSFIRCDETREQLTENIRAEHPERASNQALEITGRTLSDIIKGKTREDVVSFVNEWLARDGLTPEHRCILAHNSNFDKRFCHALWESVGEVFPAVCWLDTIQFARKWVEVTGNLPDNYKLHSLLKFAGVKPRPGIHNAKSDAQNTYLLWKKGMATGLIDHLPLIQRWEHKIIND